MSNLKLLIISVIVCMSLVACAKPLDNNTGKQDEKIIKEEIVEGVTFEEVDISDYENDKLYQQISYPVVSIKGMNISKSAIDDMNKKFKDAAEKFKKDNKADVRNYMKEYYKNEGEDADEVFYLHQVEMNVLTNNDDYLSITSRTDENLLGAHGSYIIEGWNFDKKTGKKLSIFDMVKSKDDIKKYIIKWCEDNKDEIGLFDEYKDTIDKYFAGENEIQFSIDNEDVLITFQVYDLAPYAAGPIEITVPKEYLK